MDYFEVIEKRHSVRAYKNDIVEPEKLEKIINAAILAPTAVNFQPFKLFIICTQKHLSELKEIYKREWFLQAPYVLCICAMQGEAWVRRHDGRSYADVDAAIVMDHIILAATALGLGTCWVGNFNADAARKMLLLDEKTEPLLFTPLGYEAEQTVQKIGRKPAEELVSYI